MSVIISPSVSFTIEIAFLWRNYTEGFPHWAFLFFSLVQYQKPKEILTLERELLQEVKKLKGMGDGDVDCKTQWILSAMKRKW